MGASCRSHLQLDGLERHIRVSHEADVHAISSDSSDDADVVVQVAANMRDVARHADVVADLEGRHHDTATQRPTTMRAR